MTGGLRRLARQLDSRLRSGSWLTPERARVYPALVGGLLAIALVVLVTTARGCHDAFGHVLGTDFAGVWVAGRAVLAGHAAAPYDNASHAAAQITAFGPSDGFLPWPYPPYFLALAALAATMPYLLALALWQAGTLALYLRTVFAAARGTRAPARGLVIAALAYPAVAINLVHGHNGFLTGALVAGGALQIERRPVLAGVLLGLLAYKPQFALMVPFALLAGRHWRAGATTVATVVAASALTIAAFGVAPWLAFFDGLAFTRHVVLEEGGLESYKLQSVFAAVRLLGGPVRLAYAAQGCVALLVAIALCRLWRGDGRAPVDIRLRMAGLTLASLLATPYVVDYDLVMLGLALAALLPIVEGPAAAPYGRTLLAFAWIIPLGARVLAKVALLPVGAVAVVALFVWVVASAHRPAPEALVESGRHGLVTVPQA